LTGAQTEKANAALHHVTRLEIGHFLTDLFKKVVMRHVIKLMFM